MPLRVAIVLIVVTLLTSLLLGALGGLRMRRIIEARASRTRTRRGLAAERAAEKLLKRHGYRVLARQLSGTYTVSVDGAPWDVKLSADFLVEREGRELLVEVKTGDGTRIGHADTRRQMLEYQLAFGVPGILLVDADRGTVREVCFPLATQTPARRAQWLTPALVVCALVIVWWFSRR